MTALAARTMGRRVGSQGKNGPKSRLATPLLFFARFWHVMLSNCSFFFSETDSDFQERTLYGTIKLVLERVEGLWPGEDSMHRYMYLMRGSELELHDALRGLHFHQI